MKKRCFLNRRGYFFLIDSILALTVLAVGAILIFTSYIKVPSKEEPGILSEDIMDFFANNEVKDINNAEVGLGGTYWSGNEVTACNGGPITPNPENTLLQQLGDLYEKSLTNSCYLDIAGTFIEKLTQNTLPPSYSFEFWMHDEIDGIDQLLYPDTEQVDSKNAARVIIPSKKIVYGIINQETGDMFGPYNTEVLVWQ